MHLKISPGVAPSQYSWLCYNFRPLNGNNLHSRLGSRSLSSNRRRPLKPCWALIGFPPCSVPTFQATKQTCQYHCHGDMSRRPRRWWKCPEKRGKPWRRRLERGASRRRAAAGTWAGLSGLPQADSSWPLPCWKLQNSQLWCLRELHVLFQQTSEQRVPVRSEQLLLSQESGWPVRQAGGGLYSGPTLLRLLFSIRPDSGGLFSVKRYSDTRRSCAVRH